MHLLPNGTFFPPCLSKIRVKQPLLAYCPLIDRVLHSVGGGHQQEGGVGNCIFPLTMGSGSSSLNSGGVRTVLTVMISRYN